MTKKTKVVYRDSEDGKFTRKENVKLNPSKTETEHRPVKSSKPKKK